MTRGTLSKPAADPPADDATALGTAPDTGIHPGDRAQLKELSDNALLGKLQGAAEEQRAARRRLRDTRGPL